MGWVMYENKLIPLLTDNPLLQFKLKESDFQSILYFVDGQCRNALQHIVVFRGVGQLGQA